MKQAFRLTLVIVFAVVYWNTAYAESPRTQIKQLVEQLQKTPDDNALREQIIQLASKLKPAPAIPEEARMHFVKAVTLQKDAKSPGDYDLPIQEYQQALLLAPWWSDAYFDLASALEHKQQYPEAIQNLKLSILASPNGQDARAAQDKIYALEAEQEKLVKDKAEQEQAAQADAAKYGWLEGDWNYTMTGGNGTYRAEGVIEARRSGNQVVYKIIRETTYLGRLAPSSEQSEFSQTTGLIRATIGPSGEITWEINSDDSPQCATEQWASGNLAVSSDQRTITFAQDRRFAGTCTPAPQDSYTLTHE